MSCINCGAGLCFECSNIVDGQCCCKRDPSPVAKVDDVDDIRHTRGYSRDSTLKDQQSTGRKRAAILYPIDKESPGICEWQGLRFAGGGHFPIVGCHDGRQTHRHHGPDKNTLNNDEGNVHRICVNCHNRWHTKNDDNYESGDYGRPHDSNTKASELEIVQSEAYWIRNKVKKIKGD